MYQLFAARDGRLTRLCPVCVAGDRAAAHARIRATVADVMGRGADDVEAIVHVGGRTLGRLSLVTGRRYGRSAYRRP